jgi:hypothetical protein
MQFCFGVFDLVPFVGVLFKQLFGVIELVLHALNMQFQLLLDFDMVTYFSFIFLKLALIL